MALSFQDIEQFPRSYWYTDCGFDYLEKMLDSWNDRDSGSPLILNPEWQRGHVWTEEQQIAFMEYMLKGGTTGRVVYFNCSSWGRGYNTPVYCLDGLQRITTVLKFMRNELPAFGHTFKQFDGLLRGLANDRFQVHMLNIENKKDLLKVYLDFNSGGTPHNPKELDRVAKMIQDTPDDETV